MTKQKKSTPKGANLSTLNDSTTKRKKTQSDLILKYLQTHKGISSMQAFEKFKITRLSGRIYDLKKQGNNITTLLISKNGTTYAEYRLEK